MIAVSPWFSTHFNSKNWVFICEQLITDRWNQMLTMQPALIEIISWNGKSSSNSELNRSLIKAQTLANHTTSVQRNLIIPMMALHNGQMVFLTTGGALFPNHISLRTKQALLHHQLHKISSYIGTDQRRRVSLVQMTLWVRPMASNIWPTRFLSQLSSKAQQH